MIQDWFCSTYSSIQDRNSFLMRIRLYSILRWLTRWTANFILPIVFKCHPSKACISPIRNPQLIVSLTTFPSRIDKIWLVIECIFRQTKLPDKLILWLSKEQFSTIDMLPYSLLRYKNRGLDIQLRENDLKSHKKYIYTLQEYHESILITIDDDIFYHSTLIEDLYKQHINHPHDIVANYTHNIRYDKEGRPMPYTQWEDNVLQGNSLFFGSGGGTLIPPHSLHPNVVDFNVAMHLCPHADDIWLNAMARIQNTKVVHTSRYCILLPIINSKTVTLFSSNRIGGNDEQIIATNLYCENNFNQIPF